MADDAGPMLLGWVIVYVDDPPAAREFYMRAFGLQGGFVAGSGTYAELDTGATKLAFAAYALGEENFPGGVRRGALPATARRRTSRSRSSQRTSTARTRGRSRRAARRSPRPRTSRRASAWPGCATRSGRCWSWRRVAIVRFGVRYVGVARDATICPRDGHPNSPCKDRPNVLIQASREGGHAAQGGSVGAGRRRRAARRRGGGGDGDGTTAEPPCRSERKAAVAERYADLVHAAYGASIASAEKMGDAIERFLDRPTQARLAAARKAWIAARDDYVVTEPFRFYGGPIDDPKTGPEGLLNAWPMDEAYVDYVAGDPDAGIVNDRDGYPKITEDVIVEGNEKGGETNISSGWHAIEFLLWGQDRSKDGPGARPASDYSTARNARRRATYLRLTTERLLSDLRQRAAPWAPDGGAYRAEFLDDPDAALTKIFRGIGALSSHELAGERMAVAFESTGPGGRALLLQRQHERRRRQRPAGASGWSTRRTGPSDDAPSRRASTRSWPRPTQSWLRRCATALDASLAKAQAFPATFETMIAAPSGSKPATRRWRRRSRRSRRRASCSRRRPRRSTSR